MKNRFASLISLCLFGGLLVFSGDTFAHTRDDGWRRTSHGWERLLVSEKNSPGVKEPRLPRIHPLLLACWQAAAGIGGLMIGEGAMRHRAVFTVND